MLVHLLDIKKLQKTGGEEFIADASGVRVLNQTTVQRRHGLKQAKKIYRR